MAANNTFGSHRPAGPQNTNYYQPFVEDQPDGTIASFQSVTFSVPHGGYSFEELRLNDQANGRGVVKRPAADLTSFTSTLAFANVRQRLNAFCTPWFARRTHSDRGLRLGSKIVVFSVGKENPKDFAIHESVIKPVSEFVKLALEKDWKEAKERLIPLPEDRPEVFELLQNWLYTKNIPSLDTKDAVKDAAEYKMLIQAYILGDKFGITDFKDAIIDCIILKLRYTGRFDARLATFVYENTLDESPLRRLWQDIYV